MSLNCSLFFFDNLDHLLVGVSMSINNLEKKLNALSFAQNSISTLNTIKSLTPAQKEHQAMLSELFVDLSDIRDELRWEQEAHDNSLIHRLKDTM